MPYEVGLKICFEEPSDKMSDDFEFGLVIDMIMSVDHEFSVTWKTNMNGTNLY